MLFSRSDGHRRKTIPLTLPPLHRAVLIALTMAVVLGTACYGPLADMTAPAMLAGSRLQSLRIEGSDAAPHFTQSWVTPPGHTESAHSSAICALPSGDLLAVWYGGTREGAPDVALFTSRLSAGGAQWSAPVHTVDRALAQDELDRMIKKYIYAS